ncbi:MAG: sigma 54-interacting transcriptional regulator [Candidatus Desulfatibia sp.]|uniref:sigma-54 interaction domain-containing protein n=1 Tax=Candidatus Desulfatibia sp. TaxID=3101189 RepID=UPI002F302C01
MSITPTSDQLEKRVKELEARVEHFKRAETMCPKNEKAMQAIVNAMGERVKELNCLYSISSLVEKHDFTLEEILQGTVNIIPPSWQYPETTCSRIVLEDREYGTDNFKKTNWKQSSDILVHGMRIGSLEVYYLKKMPEIDEGPFLKEERSLINAIAERLGKVIERIKARNELQKKNYELGERIKELNCLYNISSLVEKQGITLEEILQGTINIIPPSWQYPEITCARIIMEGQEYKTKNFKETDWVQSSDINVHDETTGVVEVYYLKEKPEIDEGPFLKEERSLINAITIQLGSIVERIRSERALQESEARYKILTEQVADGVALFQEGLCLFANNAFASMFGYENTSRAEGIKVVDLISNDFKKPFLKFHEDLEADGSSERIFQGKYMTNDRREFWAEAHLAKIKWNGKPAVLSTIRDITKSKFKEIEIQKESEHLRQENIKLRSSIKERFRFGDIIGKSPSMQEVYELILKAGASNASVIIYGESGTGKELVAHAVHKMSTRADKKLVPINCGAIPEMLLEREFFGHIKGAFTGADKDAHGYLDLADHGTLFLDEVGELDLNMQVKLLRAFDNGCFSPVGSNRTRMSAFRIVAATNKNLMDLVNQGLMREDFFYRINVIPISIPPLRDRKEDIPLLIDHYLKKYNGNNAPSISGKIMEALQNYNWPGNVRQLQNALHRYITLKKLDFMGTAPSRSIELDSAADEEAVVGVFEFQHAVRKFEKNLVIKALDQNQWHREKAAAALGLPRRTFFRKMKNFGLTSAQTVPFVAHS